MDLQARPVILARLIQKNGAWYIENHIVQLEIETDFTEIVYEIYILANGSKTLHELVGLYPASDVIGFISFLEEKSLAADVLSVAMLGHSFAAFPDDYRPILDNDEVLTLQMLPPDPAVECIEISQKPDEIDKRRVTQRIFTGLPIDLPNFESIVLSSYGITNSFYDHNSRSIPSAGAIYALTQDFIVLNVQSLENGVYRLARHSNSLYCLGLDYVEVLSSSMPMNEWEACSFVQVVSFDITRSSVKYGSRAHRFAILEAGHSAQNAIRKATELGIGTWEYGGYNDFELEARLGLRHPKKGIATTVFYGRL